MNRGATLWLTGLPSAGKSTIAAAVAVRLRAGGRRVDGLDGDEHPFLACSFWLVQQYAASGRSEDAVRLMDRLCALANDVGLLSEGYDVAGQRHAGNTPQALSHLALVGAADALVGHYGRGRASAPKHPSRVARDQPRRASESLTRPPSSSSEFS